MLLYPWTLLSLSDEKSITSFRLPEAVGVNSNLAVARSLGPTVPTLKGEKPKDKLLQEVNGTKNRYLTSKKCSFWPKQNESFALMKRVFNI